VGASGRREEFAFFQTTMRRPDAFRLIALPIVAAGAGVTESRTATILVQEGDRYWNGPSEVAAGDFRTALGAVVRADRRLINVVPLGLTT
jgi:hypothetical protein